MLRNSSKKRISYNLIKSILIGLAIPILATWMWFSVNGNPIDEYRLITQGIKTIGKIY